MDLLEYLHEVRPDVLILEQRALANEREYRVFAATANIRTLLLVLLHPMAAT